ncbi:Acyl-CoA N-acyltransferase [Penicillium mononematosum]|uniref:Acyl-CoA N-acyltransferase n=1 Tax=Penicillium mononematosum TaxID=268346 RepID=UPI0025495F16|nr:Acyl-CoA N-acyltransferase [Penicillium mononematosum]KAJ6178588.1 Acyl-CoA N-acyltransferase [Penicillium mononematosum]
MAICIYEHDAATIIPALISELPYSTTVLRRIQHGIAYPYETAHILATFPPGSTPEPGQPWLAARVDLFGGRTTQMLIYSSLEAEHTSIPIVTVSDTKTTAPEILNVDSTRSNNIRNNTNDNKDDNPVNISKPIVSTFSASPSVLALARSQLLALLSYVKINLLPPYLSYLAKTAQATSAEAENTSVSMSSGTTNNTNPNNTSSVPLIPEPDPQAFLIGSLHTGLFSLLQRSGSYTQSDPIPNIRVHRFDDPPYYKYFFRRSDFSPDEESGRSADLPFADLSLPAGYRFHDREGREGVLSKHLDLVQSRTHIPRPRAKLSTMPGVAVYSDSGSSDADEMPIAWGFLGMDGALATLHVEPEHRGRGLAVPLSKAIMRRGMSVDGVFGAGSVNSEDSQTRERVGTWAHAEVAGYNNASRRVMEKIGGQLLTTVTWTVIELLD